MTAGYRNVKVRFAIREVTIVLLGFIPVGRQYVAVCKHCEDNCGWTTKRDMNEWCNAHADICPKV